MTYKVEYMHPEDIHKSACLFANSMLVKYYGKDSLKRINVDVGLHDYWLSQYDSHLETFVKG